MNFQITIKTGYKKNPNGADINFEFTENGWNIRSEHLPLNSELEKCYPNGNPINGNNNHSGLNYLLTERGCFYFPNNLDDLTEHIWNLLKLDHNKSVGNEKFKKIETLLEEMFNKISEIKNNF